MFVCMYWSLNDHCISKVFENRAGIFVIVTNNSAGFAWVAKPSYALDYRSSFSWSTFEDCGSLYPGYICEMSEKLLSSKFNSTYLSRKVKNILTLSSKKIVIPNLNNADSTLYSCVRFHSTSLIFRAIELSQEMLKFFVITTLRYDAKTIYAQIANRSNETIEDIRNNNLNEYVEIVSLEHCVGKDNKLDRKKLEVLVSQAPYVADRANFMCLQLGNSSRDCYNCVRRETRHSNHAIWVAGTDTNRDSFTYILLGIYSTAPRSELYEDQSLELCKSICASIRITKERYCEKKLNEKALEGHIFFDHHDHVEQSQAFSKPRKNQVSLCLRCIASITNNVTFWVKIGGSYCIKVAHEATEPKKLSLAIGFCSERCNFIPTPEAGSSGHAL